MWRLTGILGLLVACGEMPEELPNSQPRAAPRAGARLPPPSNYSVPPGAYICKCIAYGCECHPLDMAGAGFDVRFHYQGDPRYTDPVPEH